MLCVHRFPDHSHDKGAAMCLSAGFDQDARGEESAMILTTDYGKYLQTLHNEDHFVWSGGAQSRTGWNKGSDEGDQQHSHGAEECAHSQELAVPCCNAYGMSRPDLCFAFLFVHVLLAAMLLCFWTASIQHEVCYFSFPSFDVGMGSQIANHPLISRLHVEGSEQDLPQHPLPPQLRLCSKMELLDRILLRLHAAKHKVHSLLQVFPVSKTCTQPVVASHNSALNHC